MISWQRFKGPTAADEFAWCAGCDGRFHYTHLNDLGLCSNCRPDPIPDTDEPPPAAATESHTPSPEISDGSPGNPAPATPPAAE